MSFTLAELNGFERAAFTAALGHLFEHSPWVAEETWRMLEQMTERRSEEHTSELQSLAYIVCRLLLEKKQKILWCSWRRRSMPSSCRLRSSHRPPTSHCYRWPCCTACRTST